MAYNGHEKGIPEKAYSYSCVDCFLQVGVLSCIMWGCELTIDDRNIRDEGGEEEGEGAEDTMELELKRQDRNRIQSQNPESESR